MTKRSRPAAPHLFRWRVEIPHDSGDTGPDGTPDGGVHLFIVDAHEAEHALAEALARAESEDARRHRRHTPLAIDLHRVSVVKLCHVA
ncbi:hypothetical protein [Kitasatospora sp. NPDC051914]|uniref:hypothetical protein n=1 Tax=unclassified Kitasatospora TaxID=2633591 RepID=UPI003424CCAA